MHFEAFEAVPDCGIYGSEACLGNHEVINLRCCCVFEVINTKLPPQVNTAEIGAFSMKNVALVFIRPNHTLHILWYPFLPSESAKIMS